MWIPPVHCRYYICQREMSKEKRGQKERESGGERDEQGYDSDSLCERVVREVTSTCMYPWLLKVKMTQTNNLLHFCPQIPCSCGEEDAHTYPLFNNCAVFFQQLSCLIPEIQETDFVVFIFINISKLVYYPLPVCWYREVQQALRMTTSYHFQSGLLTITLVKESSTGSENDTFIQFCSWHHYFRLEPEYYDLVSKPIDMIKIQHLLKNEDYEGMDQLSEDVHVMVSNAKMYYAVS